MAQITRNLPPLISTTVTSGRLQGGLHTISSSDITPVEETGSIAQDSVLFNDALLSFFLYTDLARLINS